MSINTCLQFFKIMNPLIIREVVAVRRRWERPITSIQFPILWKPCGCLLLQSRGSKTFRMLVMIFRPFSFVSFLKVYIAKWIEKVVLYFFESQNKVKVDGRSFPLNQDCKTVPDLNQSHKFDIQLFKQGVSSLKIDISQ